MKFRRKCLLPLSNVPARSKLITDWQPFLKGDTLVQIVDRFNERCIDLCKKANWSDLTIETFLEIIDIIPCDLANVDKLTPAEFENTRILMLDLDAIIKMSEPDWTQKKNWLIFLMGSTLMGSKFQSYYLPQVSIKPGIRSCKWQFNPLPVCPSEPEILSDQKQFEDWLFQKFCEVRCQIKDSDEAYSDPEYIKDLADVVDQIQDHANMKGLSKDELQSLAKKAALQELTLAHVTKQVREMTGRTSVVLDAIRLPIEEISSKPILIERPLRKIDFMEVHLSLPMNKLTDRQRNVAIELGIKGRKYAAVHLNQPGTKDLLRELKGVINVSEFSVKLPK
jgi:hypothetical protein